MTAAAAASSHEHETCFREYSGQSLTDKSLTADGIREQ